MDEIMFIIEDADEGGYIARALGASIFTEADSLDELHELIRDAVRCHFDEAVFPRIIRLKFINLENINQESINLSSRFDFCDKF